MFVQVRWNNMNYVVSMGFPEVIGLPPVLIRWIFHRKSLYLSVSMDVSCTHMHFSLYI